MNGFSLLLVTAAIAIQPAPADAQVFNGTPFDVLLLAASRRRGGVLGDV
jgi:hypothetical protein